MIYEFMGEIVTEEALEARIDDEVDRASFNSYALAHDENTSTFDEFDSKNIDRFDNWTNEIIEKAIFNDFQSADFDDYGYTSEEELEENASWSSELFRLM